MIEYADYEFYSNTYKGSLSGDLFNVNREITEDDLNNEEHNFGYKIKYTTCLLLDYINSETNTNGAVKSISIDGVSKTIKSLEETKKDKQNILNNLPQELVRYI